MALDATAALNLVLDAQAVEVKAVQAQNDLGAFASSDEYAQALAVATSRGLVNALLDVFTGSNNTGLNRSTKYNFDGKVSVEIPAATFLIGATGGPSPVIPVVNPAPVKAVGAIGQLQGKGVGNT